MKTQAKLSAMDLTYTALMVVLISLCSWISVPSAVPFTMQTFGVFCALSLLGGRRGTMAVLIYILMGAIGLPVFSNFTGGIGKLMGPTGGYIIGFLFTAIVYWLLEGIADKGTRGKVLVLLIGLALCYAFGTAWFVVVYSNSSGPIGVITALGWCVFPFIVPDLIKLVLAMVLVRTLSPHLKLR